MKLIAYKVVCYSAIVFFMACGKSGSDPAPAPVVPKQVSVKTILLNTDPMDDLEYGVTTKPSITIRFSEPVKPATVAAAVTLTSASGGSAPVFTTSLQNQDSVLVVQTTSDLSALNQYVFSIGNELKSASGGNFISTVNKRFITRIDSSSKFPAISDDELLTLVQRQTFKYFWDFGHPVSGLVRERNNSGDVVTSGGSGFGVMALVTAVERNFITRAQGLERLKTMVTFLKEKAQKFHGAFPHWLNGATGAAVAFSQKDNGADLVETSFLVMGLITARQYFDDAGAEETTLRNDINTICNGVEWNWFRKNNEEVLYWHWSSTYNWDMNMPIRGWNECLITYVLAASSATNAVPASVYTQGWASAGGNGFTNGNTYLGVKLPLGPAYGGPLFFSHYSFMGINPTGLTDTYTNYMTQNTAHAQINYNYCVANPKGQYGYSDMIWGLTASDIPGGYTASSPTNDVGVIAPTAALASFPYTPDQSMKALKFFYYILGDKLWKDYGFVDAFSLKELWFADSYIAIDQGPIIVMIENYRTGLLWDMFTSAPEVKAGMKKLGFTAPYL
ncbi:glucoamylase family protein [Flavihumibacter stibioxidans]|uniref:Beta-glucosidase n=1 Tax=Flavihumibacter stibioxidans TaxID=1834163 RepID=A0ABR7M875_9BACT|nr:glucoamylase family protein [Flavihumibacter stibioxidans]MBC6491238.1 beta-glucosidase [Flavihumibacter stibioxidans]